MSTVLLVAPSRVSNCQFGVTVWPRSWRHETVELPEPFTDVATHQVEWTNYMTAQALIDYVASRSYCITSPADVRTRTLEEVRTLLATHPALANSGGIAVPYVTVCVRATTA